MRQMRVSDRQGLVKTAVPMLAQGDGSPPVKLVPGQPAPLVPSFTLPLTTFDSLPRSDCMDSKLRNMASNPYGWSPRSAGVSTSVSSLDFANSGRDLARTFQ